MFVGSRVPSRKFDVVIIGAGGSGMRASLQLARAGLNVAVLSKVFPTRSHTVAAQGGIAASLANAAGDHIVVSASRSKAHKPLPADAADRSLERLARLDASTAGEYSQAVADDIRQTMQRHAAVFRTQALMDEGVRRIEARRARVAAIELKDKSRVFNTARIEALEVENLIEVARATMASAAARRECRGAHTVKDYERPADDPSHPVGRNDQDWLKHTLWYRDGDRLEYKPVRMTPLTVDSVPPAVRTF